MKDNRKRKSGKKYFVRTAGVLLASMVVISTGTNQWVLASVDSKSAENVITEDETREKIIIYLNGQTGNDDNTGLDAENAVKSFDKAKSLVKDYGIIRILDTVDIKDDQVWNIPSGVSIERMQGFDKALLNVEGSLTLENVKIHKDDITGKGKVTGAAESDKYYIPMVYYADEPTALSEIHLSHCEGEGVFFWENEKIVPEEYEMEATVVFQPGNTKENDYKEEEGWDEKDQTIKKSVKVITASLKKDETPAPETDTTPEVTPEVQPTPEVTPEAQPTPEVTPEAQPTPEVTPEVQPTPEVTPEAQPTPEVTPEVQPTPEVTPEAQPTPEVTPEAQPTPEMEQQVPQIDILELQQMIDYLPRQVESQEVVEAVLDVTRQYEALSEEEKAAFSQGSKERLENAWENVAAYNRTSNHVTIEGDLPWYVQFQVTLNNDKKDKAVLEDYNVDTFIAPYDMQLWDLMNNKEYLLNGQQVKITLPAPAEGLYTKLTVVHYKEDGTVDYITPILNGDGTMSFVTDSFSPYNIVGSKIAGSSSLVGNTDHAYESVTQNSERPAVNTNTNNSTNQNANTSRPQNVKQGNQTSPAPAAPTVSHKLPITGDDQPVIIYLSIAAIAILAVIIIAVIMKKKK